MFDLRDSEPVWTEGLWFCVTSCVTLNICDLTTYHLCELKDQELCDISDPGLVWNCNPGTFWLQDPGPVCKLTSGALDLCGLRNMELCVLRNVRIMWPQGPCTFDHRDPEPLWYNDLDLCKFGDPGSLLLQQIWTCASSRNLYLCDLRGPEPLWCQGSCIVWIPDLEMCDIGDLYYVHSVIWNLCFNWIQRPYPCLLSEIKGHGPGWC